MSGHELTQDYSLDASDDEEENGAWLWRRYMTVCIGTLAEKSKAIVMLSDKALTYSGAAALQWDTSIKKIRRIGSTFWYALIAGDPTFALNTISSCESLISSQPNGQSVSKTAAGIQGYMKAAYQQRRKKIVHDTVLAPRLLTEDLLVARRADLQPLDPKFFSEVSDEAYELKTNSSILVCGFDETDEPHIFSVVNPGVVSIYDLTGFHAVGIGQKTALARLLILDAEKKDKLSLALYQAFDAKANAEIHQGVGFEFDASILVRGISAVEVPRSIIRLLENLMWSHPDTPFQKPKDVGAKPKKWESRLDAFAEKVLAKARPRPKSTPRRSKSKQ